MKLGIYGPWRALPRISCESGRGALAPSHGECERRGSESPLTINAIYVNRGNFGGYFTCMKSDWSSIWMTIHYHSLCKLWCLRRMITVLMIRSMGVLIQHQLYLVRVCLLIPRRRTMTAIWRSSAISFMLTSTKLKGSQEICWLMNALVNISSFFVFLMYL